jgi:hypothetical protein
VWVSWTFTEEQAPSLRHINDILGSYMTAGACLRLWLPRQAAREGVVLWYRQRSVCTENWWTASNHMCRQSGGHGVRTSAEWIYSRIFSGGPKNYAYKVINKTTGKDKTM